MFRTYDDWKCTEPDPYEGEEPPYEDDGYEDWLYAEQEYFRYMEEEMAIQHTMEASDGYLE